MRGGFLVFTTFDAIFYTLAFAVPGFLIDYIIKKFIPKKDLCENKNLLYYLYLSCINYAVWSWLIYILYHCNIAAEHPLLCGIIWGGIIFISPIFVSLAILLLNKYELLRKVSRLLGLNMIDPIPTAWDYKFSKIEGERWVILTLVNDQYYAGLWGTNSFASSEAGERDIFLEEAYTIKEDGTWEKTVNTDGILIKGELIRAVQFFKV